MTCFTGKGYTTAMTLFRHITQTKCGVITLFLHNSLGTKEYVDYLLQCNEKGGIFAGNSGVSLETICLASSSSFGCITIMNYEH